MRLFLPLLLSVLTLPPCSLWAGQATEQQYQKTHDYISKAFGGESIPSQVLWVTKDLRPDLKTILHRDKFPLRYRYYQQNNRTVWILNEIGKILPITTGVTIEDGKIINLTVLTYRESHGSEIRFPAYSRQYNAAALTNDLRLSNTINGISGATLSSNAMKRVSRLALYLHKKVMEKYVPTSSK